MSQTEPSRHALRVADLPQRAVTPFDITLDAQETDALRRLVALDGLRKVRLTGTLEPLGRKDWLLQAKLGATVVQPCVATLEPVQTRIDTPVTRQFLKDFEEIEEPEAEVPDDDSREALGAYIDLWHVLGEALSLAVPLYPRAETVEGPVEIRVTEPGKEAMSDDAAKPFAGLAALKAQLGGSDENT